MRSTETHLWPNNKKKKKKRVQTVVVTFLRGNTPCPYYQSAFCALSSSTTERERERSKKKKKISHQQMHVLLKMNCECEHTPFHFIVYIDEYRCDLVPNRDFDQYKIMLDFVLEGCRFLNRNCFFVFFFFCRKESLHERLQQSLVAFVQVLF